MRTVHACDEVLVPELKRSRIAMWLQTIATALPLPMLSQNSLDSHLDFTQFQEAWGRR